MNQSTINTFQTIEDNRQRQADLMAQLRRQLDFEQDFGIAAHDIRSMRVRGRGTDNRQTWVTMKDGTEHHMMGIDVKHCLDGVEDWRQ
jgi:hypothetical protein